MSISTIPEDPSSPVESECPSMAFESPCIGDSAVAEDLHTSFSSGHHSPVSPFPPSPSLPQSSRGIGFSEESTLEKHKFQESILRRQRVIILNALKIVTVEPFILCYLIAWTLQSTLTTNMLLEKVCQNKIADWKTVCNNLSSYPQKEDQVQQIVNNLNMYMKLIQHIPTVFFVLFMGSWSDRNGRKLPMVLSMIGCFLTSMINLMNSYFWWIPAEHILMSAVPRAMTGGFISLMMAAYSYISDITKDQSRTSRIAILDLMIVLGPPTGLYLSDVMYSSIGYTGVYSVSACIFVICIMYIILCLEETRGPLLKHKYELVNDHEKRSNSSLFNVRHVKTTMNACLRKRANHGRRIIFILTFALCCMTFIYGSVGMVYLYTKKKFSWTYSQYVHLGITEMISGGIGTICILPLLSLKLQIDDNWIGIVGCMSRVATGLVQAFAFKPYHLYLAACVAILAETPISVTRSEISKIVPPEELGKVFSILASWESVIPLISTPLYTFIYNATIDVFPGAFFCVGTFAYALALVLFIWLLKY